MENSVRSKLLEARPKLSAVAPLTHAICWGYVVINLLLGTGMYFLYETSIPLSVANVLSYQAWGVLFGSLGVLGAWGLLRNNWKLTKRLLIWGLALKAIWAIALIIRCIAAPQTILITAVWLFFAYIQAATYIYFLPKNPTQKEPIQ